MDKDGLRDLGTDERMTGVLKWIRPNGELSKSVGTLLTRKVSSDLHQLFLTDQTKWATLYLFTQIWKKLSFATLYSVQNIRKRTKSKYAAILAYDKFVSSSEALYMYTLLKIL
jgi:hypothetical protein